MTTYVTAPFEEGREAQASAGARNPYLSSSPYGIAFDAGRWCHRTMTPAPARVRMSHGCSLVLEYKDRSQIKLRWAGDDRVERIGQ